MERYDIPEDPRLAAAVRAATDGHEVFIVRDGEEVARVTPVESGRRGKVDLDAIRAVRAKYGIRVDDAAALIRDMREMDDH